MHPNTKKTHQNMSLGSNGMDRVRSCLKFRCEFVARTFALIAPVQPISHRVSCSNEKNAPKYYKMNQYIILGSNGVDCVRSLPKIRCDFVPRTFALIAPVQPISHRVSCSNGTNQNAHYKTHRFMSLVSNGVDRVRSLRKTLMRFRSTNFFIN